MSHPGRERARVALVVDHPQRDLAGLVLTAMELCRRGIVVHLVPLNLQAHEIWSLGPDLVVLNYLRPGNDRLARQLLAAGMRLGVLDTEGGAWEDCRAYSELFWRDRALLRQLSFACMWGPRLAEHLVAEGLLEPAQVVVTGCPRFDFYSPRWRTVFAGSVEPAHPLILINTSFSYGNPRFASPERNRERLERELGLGAERVDAYLAAERRAVDGMVELARALSADVPECRVVLRPHPFEDPAAYRIALQGCPGVSVDTTGPVQPWIFRSAAVVQRSCSTAIEAALAGVPALSPQWIPAPAVVPVAESVSVPCATYEELRLRVRSILSPGTQALPRTAPQPALTEWFFHCDGLAHHRVGEAVAGHLPARRSVNAGRCREQLYGLGPETGGLRRRLGAWLRYWLRLSPDQAFRPGQPSAAEAWDRSHKQFGTGDVEALVSAIRAASEAQGGTAPAVTVEPARAERWAAAFRCRSVTISPAG